MLACQLAGVRMDLLLLFILQLNQNVNAKILKKHGFNLLTCLQILISLLKGHHQLLSRPEYAQQVGTFTS